MKKRNYLNPNLILYDFTLMGINALVPLIGMLLTYLFLYFLCFKAQYDSVLYLAMSETTITFIGSWWIYHLMRPIVEDNGGELYLTFPVKRIFLGVIRVVEMWLIYVLLLMVYCIGINIISGISIINLWFQLSLQSLFFFSFGFFWVVVTRSASYCWIISVAYAAFYVLTENNHFKLLSIYTLSSKDIEISAFITGYSFKILLFSMISLVAGQLVFDKK